MNETRRTTIPPLQGLRVIDVSTMIAGPTCGQILADFGAEVVKVEHPRDGDALRTHGPSGGAADSLWWKTLSRNKRSIGLDLGTAQGSALLLDLIKEADVLIEAFRPGTLERFGLSWERLRDVNPDLILLRFSGFGQTGPYSSRPAFGTLIEAMSGFASMTGEPDGPPTLPPFGLADSIAGLAGVGAALMALYARDVQGEAGQVIDLSILEALASVLGPAASVYRATGTVTRRTGNMSENNAPRNTYLTKDQRWVAISSSATSIAERVMRMVGRPEYLGEPWFASGHGRATHVEELDAAVADWIGKRTREEVLEAFDEWDIAGAPVYEIDDYVDDVHVKERQALVEVADADHSSVLMQNLLFRLSGTPGSIRHTGEPRGASTGEVLQELLGLSDDQVERLMDQGVIA